MGIVLALAVLSAQALAALPKSTLPPPPEAKWEDVTEKIPGVSKAFFLDSKTESCLVVLTGEELRFSTGKGARGANDVLISHRKGIATYKNGLNGKALKVNDPVFAHCAARVKAAPELTPDLRARFLGFGGIK